MNKHVKKGLKVTGIVVGAIAVIYLCLRFVFYFATKPAGDKTKQTNEIVLERTSITIITRNYHLSRSVESNSLAGVSRKGKKYYFIYLSKSKKTYLYQANKGKSKEQILKILDSAHPGHDNLKCQLGWHKGIPVWEVTYHKKNGNYGYVPYNLKGGRELAYAGNL